ncbi:hypothetical protein SAMN05660479_01994 [Microbulbifer thermotolerans]|nr:hypothetical protein [Microbulbifer thermotolerans]WKT59846.1 hypothetical protein Q2E61_13190 [Microbulbifer thermotolerans]SFC58220.1 hypothetical protein SAMN05660479_01994 [Microbulbifer thermotolerans]
MAGFALPSADGGPLWIAAHRTAEPPQFAIIRPQFAFLLSTDRRIALF